MPAGEHSRTTPRWLMGLTVVLLAARVASGLFEREHPSVPRSLVEWVDWREAESLSRERGLPILYDFTADWCPPCNALDRGVFHKNDIAQGINESFIPVRLKDRETEDGTNPPHIQQLITKYKVKGFPHLIIVGTDGKEARRQVGYESYTETVRFLGLVQ